MAGSRVPGSIATLALIVALSCLVAVGSETGEAPQPAPAPETPPLLTLEGALALALARSPELDDFSWGVQAAEAREVQANTIPNPELDVRLWRLGERPGLEPDRSRRIILNQEIELGGKRRRRVDLARIDSQLAGLDYKTKRAELEAVVSIRFAEVLGAQRRVDSLGRLVEFVEALQGAAATMVESGALRSLEIHQISRRLGLARVDLQRAEAELATARFALAATWGGTSPGFETAVGELERAHSVPDVETIIEMARQTAGRDLWETELARSQAALSLAKAGGVPDFRFGLGVRWDTTVDEPDYMLDLEIDLPLYDRKQGEIREAKTEISRVKARQGAAAAEDARRIAELYYELEATAARNSTLADEVVPAARAAFEAIRRGFEGQEADLDELLDARRDLAGAEVQQAEALVEYRQALASLEGLVGSDLTISNP